MYPELFKLGPITVYCYGVLLAVSYLLGLRLAMSRAKKRDLDSNRVLDLGIYIIIAALVGAKLLLLVVDFEQFQHIARGDLLSLLRSGGVFYGGLILAVVVAFWYIARHKMPFWTTCDVFAPGIALGHVTGRLGCFAAGCCYGKPTDVSRGRVIFTDPLAAANVGTPLGIPLHPTQLYEAGAELLILGSCWRPNGAAAGSRAARSGSTCSSMRSRATSSRSTAATRAGDRFSASRRRSSSRWSSRRSACSCWCGCRARCRPRRRKRARRRAAA